MTTLLAASIGLVVAGWPGALAAAVLAVVWARRRRRPEIPSMRSILLVMLVELRAGLSTLAALQTAAAIFPEHPELVTSTRIATVNGLTAAVGAVSGDMNRLLTQLARAQRSGAPASRAVRSLLESGIAEERARRISAVRSLPVKLMLPISLMLLPGLMLLFYAPGLLRLLGDLTGPFT